MKRLLHALAALWPERRGGGSPPLPDTRTGILQHRTAVLRMDRILGEFADSPIRKFAKETAGAGAPGELILTDRKNELSKRQQSKFANTQIRESAKKPLLTIVIPVIFMCLMAAKQVSAQAEPAEAAELNIFDTSENNKKGRVLRAFSFEPIEGVRIKLKGTGKQAFSDTAGYFLIPREWKGREIVISAHGYEPKAVSLSSEGTLARGATTIFLQKDISHIKPLAIGDSIPDYLWDLPLATINHLGYRKSISLREYSDRKLIVLDFWATWCSPCVKTLDAWNGMLPQFADDIAVVGIHVSRHDKVPGFIEGRGWHLPIIVCENSYVVNRHFFKANQVGMVVFIKDGRFYAVPHDKGFDADQLQRILAGEPVDIVSDLSFTYGKGDGV